MAEFFMDAWQDFVLQGRHVFSPSRDRGSRHRHGRRNRRSTKPKSRSLVGSAASTQKGKHVDLLRTRQDRTHQVRPGMLCTSHPCCEPQEIPCRPARMDFFPAESPASPPWSFSS
ncbi:hypothetical protein GOP47_0009761 [Adiantum capillus-veneris]|uniref:Uncharacterized protein n=1 Tax=Adiantum capillus-veneris TaxID=13818 RepID=A0A9D4ZJZ3_ADICA|nr:hypothetical protein GOP47_0009761 [Adiantum capillus-veneris]